MRIRLPKPRIPIRTVLYSAARCAVALSITIFLLAAISFSESPGNHARQEGSQQEQQKSNQNVKGGPGGYVGSKVCSQCHAPIANKPRARIWAVQCPKSPPLCSRKSPTPPQLSTTGRRSTSVSTLRMESSSRANMRNVRMAKRLSSKRRKWIGSSGRARMASARC